MTGSYKYISKKMSTMKLFVVLNKLGTSIKIQIGILIIKLNLPLYLFPSV